MKFICSAEINSPIENVVSLFKDPTNLRHWQDGFIRTEPFLGVPGQIGSKTKMYYKFRKNEMELLETLQSNGPQDYAGLYEHKHMSNTLKTKFSSINNNQTLVTQEAEYIQFKGFIPKLMMLFFPGMFKKQAQKWLDQFKLFVEEGEKDY